jgi:hypothetical protein
MYVCDALVTGALVHEAVVSEEGNVYEPRRVCIGDRQSGSLIVRGGCGRSAWTSEKTSRRHNSCTTKRMTSVRILAWDDGVNRPRWCNRIVRDEVHVDLGLVIPEEALQISEERSSWRIDIPTTIRKRDSWMLLVVAAATMRSFGRPITAADAECAGAFATDGKTVLTPDGVVRIVKRELTAIVVHGSRERRT